jgi:dihydroorotate dehydrogenase (NAD+) catalytic subunit
MAFGTVPAMAAEVTAEVRKVYKKVLMVKLSPNVTSITELAQAVVDGGADVITLINTLLGMAIDAERRRPVLSTITGGLSGPAVKPIALRMVWQVHKAVKVPIIGLGGIMNATDAIEFLLAGSSAIQVGTANFIDPTVSVKIAEGISAYMERHKVKAVGDLVGALRT